MKGFKIFHSCCQILRNNLFPKIVFCKNTSFFIIFPALSINKNFLIWKRLMTFLFTLTQESKKNVENNQFILFSIYYFYYINFFYCLLWRINHMCKYIEVYEGLRGLYKHPKGSEISNSCLPQVVEKWILQWQVLVALVMKALTTSTREEDPPTNVSLLLKQPDLKGKITLLVVQCLFSTLLFLINILICLILREHLALWVKEMKVNK